MAFNIYSHQESVNHLLRAGEPFVVVTLVDMRGSAPQIQGAKAVITAAGIVAGTVGGGKCEARAIDHAQKMLASNQGKSCEFVTWNLQTDVGMTCGGEVKFFFEVVMSGDWRVCVFGAGHIAQAMIPMLLHLNCRVTCIDQRQEWLDKLAEHRQLTKICTQDLRAQVRNLDPRSFFVLMTQGHATDLPVLAELLQSGQPPYVGVLGSLQKAKILRRDLAAMGLSQEKIATYFCPMGMPLGNNTPAEISVSIIAQLIQERDRLGIIQQKTKAF